jgi:hypothetical protein
LLFWLGSIEVETPRGRFVLSGAFTSHGIRRRRATDEEAASVWRFLETHLSRASYHELRPWYELYEELTSEPYYGPHGEPHLASVLDAVSFALWSKKLHFHVVEPFDPLPELEWEPPPVVPKGPTALSPSELWGRKSLIDTFIGIRLKDKKQGDPIVGSRVRVKLPDGKTKEGKTDKDGEFLITGLNADGNAEIELLDHCKPGKAEAPEWPEEQEFKATVVDELGTPVAGVWLWFRHGNASNLVKTDGSGVATYKTSGDVESVSVTFSHVDELVPLMRDIWSQTRGAGRHAWVQPEAGKAVVATLSGGQIQWLSKALSVDKASAEAPPADPLVASGEALTISVQPTIESYQFLGQSSPANGSFLPPETLQKLATVTRRFRNDHQAAIAVVGHVSNADSASGRALLPAARAAVVAAAMHEDTSVWLTQFTDAVPEEQRWSRSEELWMIGGLLGQDAFFSDNPVLGYQEYHNALDPNRRANEHQMLTEDGEMTDEVREQLVADYLHHFDTKVAERVAIMCMGAADSIPYTGDSADESSERMIEILCFPDQLGVLPSIASPILYPGDPTYEEWKHRTIQTNELTTSSGERVVRVRLLDEYNKTVTKGQWLMTDGMRVDGGFLGKDGVIEAHLSKEASTARLLTDDYDVLTQLAPVDEYPSIDSVPGALQRLSNLGYRSGPPADELDDKAAQAVREFQQEKKAKATGELDSATRDKLKEAYGC